MATTGSRTLKLSILAETKQLTEALKGSTKDVESFTDKATEFGKKAALAFAAAGAAAAAFAYQSVKNAAADEGAQRKLAETLDKTTSATTAQIAAVGGWIDKTSIAIGVTDDELRPAFSRLARSTNDVQKAQDLLNLALDISSATGKPLEAVANALGKAYDGNAASLGKLGLGIDQSILKSGNFDKIFQQLTGTFGGFAANEAQTTEKSFVRIKIAIDEAQERIGAALLPVTQKLTDFILTTGVPALNAFVGGLTGDQGLSDAFTDSEKKAFLFGEKIKGIGKTIIEFKEEIAALGITLGTIFVISKLTSYATATIAIITTLIKAYNALKASAIVAGIASYFALNPIAGVVAVGVAAAVLAAANALVENSNADLSNFELPAQNVGGYSGIPELKKPKIKNLAGGIGTYEPDPPKPPDNEGSTPPVKSGVKVTMPPIIPTNFTPFGQAGGNGSGFIGTPFGQAPVTVNIGIAGDPEATARTIVDVMNNSNYRGTGGANNFIRGD